MSTPSPPFQGGVARRAGVVTLCCPQKITSYISRICGVAISGIELLKYFINVKEVTNHELAWAVGIHLTLVFSGVMFALMDRISGSTHGKE